jgi:hypothetical protein
MWIGFIWLGIKSSGGPAGSLGIGTTFNHLSEHWVLKEKALPGAWSFSCKM